MAENSKGGWQGVLRRAPRWVVGLVIAVAWSVMILGLQFLQGEDIEAADVAITGVLGLAIAAFALWFSGRIRAKERKQPPGSPTGANITRAMSTGQLPERAFAKEWVPELAKIIRQERHLAWIGPLLFGLFTAIGIFLIFDRPEHPWFGVFCTITFLGLAVWVPISVRRRRPRIRALIDQFTGEESSQP